VDENASRECLQIFLIESRAPWASEFLALRAHVQFFCLMRPQFLVLVVLKQTSGTKRGLIFCVGPLKQPAPKISIFYTNCLRRSTPKMEYIFLCWLSYATDNKNRYFWCWLFKMTDTKIENSFFVLVEIIDRHHKKS
jgi:hypothetical protein